MSVHRPHHDNHCGIVVHALRGREQTFRILRSADTLLNLALNAVLCFSHNMKKLACHPFNAAMSLTTSNVNTTAVFYDACILNIMCILNLEW